MPKISSGGETPVCNDPAHWEQTCAFVSVLNIASTLVPATQGGWGAPSQGLQHHGDCKISPLLLPPIFSLSVTSFLVMLRKTGLHRWPSMKLARGPGLPEEAVFLAPHVPLWEREPFPLCLSSPCLLPSSSFQHTCALRRKRGGSQ